MIFLGTTKIMRHTITCKNSGSDSKFLIENASDIISFLWNSWYAYLDTSLIIHCLDIWLLPFNFWFCFSWIPALDMSILLCYSWLVILGISLLTGHPWPLLFTCHSSHVTLDLRLFTCSPWLVTLVLSLLTDLSWLQRNFI